MNKKDPYEESLKDKIGKIKNFTILFTINNINY